MKLDIVMVWTQGVEEDQQRLVQLVKNTLIFQKEVGSIAAVDVRNLLVGNL